MKSNHTRITIKQKAASRIVGYGLGLRVDTIEDADEIGIIVYDSMTPEEKDRVFRGGSRG